MRARVTWFWTAGSFAGIGYVLLRYPVHAWFAVLAFSIAAVAVVVAPVSQRRRIAAAIVLGVAARLVVAHSGFTSQGDPVFYSRLAESFARNEGLVVDISVYGPGWRAAFPPIYPILLAMFANSAVALGIVVDFAASTLLFVITRGSARAAAAYFLFPSVVLASAVPVKEGLAVALMLGCFVAVRRPVVFGALAGLLALTQPSWALLPFIAFVMFDGTPRRVATVLAACVIVMMPWWIRNWVALGTFVPLTTSAALSFDFMVSGAQHFSRGGNTEMSRVAASLAHATSMIDLTYLQLVVKRAILAVTVEDSEGLLFNGKSWAGAAILTAQAAWVALLVNVALFRGKVPDRCRAFLIAATVTMGLGIWLEFSGRHRAFLLPLLLIVIRSRQMPRAEQRTINRQPNP